MKTYLVRRALQSIPLVLLVTFLSFSLLLLLPGDPVSSLLSGGEALDEETREAYREELGLNEPIPIQYALWLKRAATGDLGTSTQTRRPITDEVQSRIQPTLQIGIAGLFVGLLLGIPAGAAAAVWRNSIIDRLITVIAVAGVAVPGFFFGILLILLFSVQLGWLPPLGYRSVLDDPWLGLKLTILPAAVIGWELSAIITRQLRSSMLEVLGNDYIRTARSKGLRERRVITMHAMRNAMLPVLTVIGLLVGRILAGAVVIETIFAIPGMGRMLVSAVNARDFPAVQGVVLLVALSVVLMNIITDLAYAALDPRIRYT